MSTAIPAPDLMQIIDTAAPGKDGLSILYTLAGSVDFRVARLAAMVTASMAGLLRAGDGTDERPSIDKYNDAMSLLDQDAHRKWAFDAAGIEHRDMVQDLKDLIGFRLTVVDRLAAVSGKPFVARWNETIARAAEPQAVAAWKIDMSWLEYVEGCHGKPEMTQDEFTMMQTTLLSGKKQDWADHASQIVETIEHLTDTALEFHDLNVKTQQALLNSISSPDRELKLRTGALKLANSPADLHARRAIISSFCAAARLALTHRLYEDKGEVQGQAEQDAARARLSEKEMADLNKDAIVDPLPDLVSDLT